MTFTKHDLEPSESTRSGLAGAIFGDDEFEEQTFSPGQAENFEGLK